MTDNFYRSFEDKHRGSRELIKSRLLVYLPLVKAIKACYPDGQAIDLGCGRGEWLELLGEAELAVKGIDIDDGMLSACREMGLTVETGEAVNYLKQLPEQSQVIVSGFHIAEHIPFAELQVLIQEALRVLKPAGLLILETPNPENIMVGTSNFYLDPTHQRPIPPPLLAFLPNFYGFYTTKVLRLQEPPVPDSNQPAKLIDVFKGVSPDYAVVAQKFGATSQQQTFSGYFDNDFGVSLDQIAAIYDQQLQTQFSQLNRLAAEAISVAKHADVAANQLRQHLQQTDAKVEQLFAQLQQAVNERNDIYASRSWRITKPLRWFGFQLRLLKQHGPTARIKALIKKLVKPITWYCFGFITKRPQLRRYCLLTIKKLGLYAKARSIYLSIHQIPLVDFGDGKATTSLKLENAHMGFKAQQIYADLLTAIENSKGRN